jgi:AraC family transcriptional regulator
MANATERRILRVLDHIHDNPTGDLSLDALVDVAALSRFHFHRLFRAMTGETMAQTVRRMRTQRAAVALVQSAALLSASARDIGYPDTASFTRAFHDTYATSPAAFR